MIKVKEINELLKAHDLPVNGRKAEKVQRLMEAGVLDCPAGSVKPKRVRSERQKLTHTLRRQLIQDQMADGVPYSEAKRATIKGLSKDDMFSLSERAGIDRESVENYLG